MTICPLRAYERLTGIAAVSYDVLRPNHNGLWVRIPHLPNLDLDQARMLNIGDCIDKKKNIRNNRCFVLFLVTIQIDYICTMVGSYSREV